jgi:S1-C subfamily serine protease
VRAVLEYLAGGLVPVSSGTGYCVAQGNYVMTNHHVIAGAKEIKIHLNGQQERYPATLIASDAPGDMALLRVDFPAGKKLVPIPMAAAAVKVGEAVCVMGWPGRVMSENDELMQTGGAVSSFYGRDDDHRMIVTDCKVDHGNSGGPLCSVCGIVGMVSQMTNDDNHYGLAIPVLRVRKFLMEHLPPNARTLPPPLTGTGNLKLVDQAEIFRPSVVYIENLQEMKSLLQRQREGQKGGQKAGPKEEEQEEGE